jgi:hypothetical protein
MRESMRRALIIGIDNYERAPLNGCVNDAVRIRDRLRSHEDGETNFDCRLLLGPPDQITAASLMQDVKQLLAAKADVALLYFAGHGTANNLGGHLIPQDYRDDRDYVRMSDILQSVDDSPVGEVLVLLDCCYSGAFGQVPAFDNRKALLREGVSVLTASRSIEAATEREGAGVFTSLLCAALDGGAADVVGNVTTAGIYSYLDESLGAWDQRPLFKAHVSRLITLRRCRPAVPVEVLRQFPRWFPTPDAELPLDPSYEPDAEPHVAEHEHIFGLLQKCRAAKLIAPTGTDHMYYAAMEGKSCHLTPLGQHYLRLAREGRL